MQSGQPQAGQNAWYEALTLHINPGSLDEHFTLGNTLLKLVSWSGLFLCYLAGAIQLQPSYGNVDITI